MKPLSSSSIKLNTDGEVGKGRVEFEYSVKGRLSLAVFMRLLTYNLAQRSFHVAGPLPLLTYAHLCCPFRRRSSWLFLLFQNYLRWLTRDVLKHVRLRKVQPQRKPTTTQLLSDRQA